jgi:hypothetical protein
MDNQQSILNFDEFLAEINSISAENKSDVQAQKLSKLLDTIPKDVASEYFKKLNPYGVNMENAPKSRMIMSYINVRENFAEKMALNSVLGYLYNSANEYDVPADVIPVKLPDYVKDPTIIDKKYPKSMLDKNPILAKHVQEYKDSMIERLIVKKFLDRHFEYNPDIHARQEFDEKDKRKTAEKVAEIRKKCANPVWLEKKQPKDTHHRLKTYIQDHYEYLRETVTAIYGIPDDIDLAMISYGEFDSEQKAVAFKNKTANSFSMATVDIPVGKMVFLGPYQNNRKAVEFYSESTAILKNMVDQRKKDAEFANDILKKRVRKAKADNVKDMKDSKDTKDIKEASKFITDTFGSAVKSQGAFAVEEEEEDLDKGLIEVPQHIISQGGLSYEKVNIYSKADSPDEVKKYSANVTGTK